MDSECWEKDTSASSRQAGALLLYQNPRAAACVYSYSSFYKMKRILCVLLHLGFFLRIAVKGYSGSSSVHLGVVYSLWLTFF